MIPESPSESRVKRHRDVSLQSCKSWSFLALAYVGAFGFVGALLLASPGKESNPVFVDVTQEAGLSAFRNIQGNLSKQHIIETMGGGAAFFDYKSREHKLRTFGIAWF
jgi:hypothetical protein